MATEEDERLAAAAPSLPEIAREVARITAENARLLRRMAEGESRFRLISRGVLKVQEAERGRISRELHDGVGQSLTALRIQLELLEQQAADPALRARVADLREMAERALQDVRQISHLLRPQMLDELGLLPTLRWLARTFEKRAGLAVELEHEGLEDHIDPDVDSLVFRLVQEALTNVAKHARVASARVRLRRGNGCLVVTVQDQGQGFDAEGALRATEEDRGFGVRGMRDRVHLFGGRFEIRSGPGAGTVLHVEIPLDRAGAPP